MKKIRENYPSNREEAYEMGLGYLDRKFVYKVFNHNNDLNSAIKEINQFLKTNGYNEVPKEELDETFTYESPDESFTLSPHGYYEAFVLHLRNEKLDINDK